jgi:Undecaprenyl-phosphate glucose phosphotransferase
MFAQANSAKGRDVSRLANHVDHALSFGIFAGLLSAFDAVLIIASTVTTGAIYHNLLFGNFDNFYRYMAIGLVAAALFVPVMFALGAYRSIRLLSLRWQVLTIMACLALIMCFLTFVIFLLGVGPDFSRGTIILSSGASAASLVGGRLLWTQAFHVAQSRGVLQQRRAVLICDSRHSIELIQAKLADAGIAVTHALDHPKADGLQDWLSSLDRTIPVNTSEIVLVTHGVDAPLLAPLLAQLQSFPLSVRLVMDPFTAGILSSPTDRVAGLTMLSVQRSQQGRVEHVAKRLFDIVISVCALVVLAPLMIVVAAAIKIEDGGPIFFCQQRRGWNNQPFRIIKLRSMSVMEDDANIRQAMRNDARVTKVGAFIRSRSIDEVPQFLNVLLGHMSVVGPRPHAVAHDDYYDQMIGKYAFRRRVKPGITGWAQVNGLRGETPTVESMEERVRFDLWYIHNWSPWLDLKIIARTISVFSNRGQVY